MEKVLFIFKCIIFIAVEVGMIGSISDINICYIHKITSKGEYIAALLSTLAVIILTPVVLFVLM